MTQKDKVKELVGKGLHSYHTKSLQQIDRIEKKNKEQNHKISILSNELDNDYLTKTEEGSVISLEHSKEGMVYLDELQGNTLVNYCTDGSKEMTLNGDIDVEGTFITTTEGVDNGKVDVMCEGNTLVNLVNHPKSFTVTKVDGQSYRQYDVPLVYPLKANKTYTIYLTVESNAYDHLPFSNIVIGKGNGDNWSYRLYWERDFGKNRLDKGIGRHKLTFTTHSRVEESSHKWIKFIFEEFAEFNTTIKDIVLLEGEHNENIDNLTGMQSVGQDDENGHKIEILSQNGNLYDYDIYTKPFGNYLSSHKIHSNGIKVKANNQDTRGCSFIRLYANEDLYISLDIVGSGSVTKKLADNTYIENYIKSNEKVRFKLEKGREYKIELNAGGTYDAEVLYDNIIISKNNYIDFIPRMFNKKEILLNEPLRYTGSTRDRFVKMGGKIFIERNTIELLLDKSVTNIGISSMDFTNKDIQLFFIRDFNNIIKSSTNNETWLNLLSDKFNSNAYNTLHRNNIEGVAITQDGAIGISILKSRLSTVDIDGFKQWLSNNNVKIICELATPIYEPLEIEPVLSCYLEVTHISNNSIIPCNMKIKNSGYNAIIKPSTLYTIALDTNKSGTIGMNLGGVKGTTTNNVLTLTTPATLTDDSLRLYGKGIKGSKVRLLEGDKTNWIPSHFEGMKSSFEDKLQDDGSYKMEILSNNENLFDLQRLTPKSNNNTFELIENGFIMTVPSGAMHSRVDYKLQNLNKNKTYRLSYKVEVLEYKEGANINNDYIGYCTGCKYYPLKSNNYTSDIVLGNTLLGFHNSNSDGITKVKFYDIQIKEVGRSTVNNFTPYKSNKIQFSSIEPLRSTKDISDRFIFKDGKIMIKRNCIERDLTYFKFSATEIKGLNLKGGITISDAYRQPQGGANTTMKCDKLASDFKEDTIPCINIYHHANQNELRVSIPQRLLKTIDKDGINDYFVNNPHKVIYRLAEPTYEEIPFELQKIILEGYENGTLFFDTNIPPTSTVTYAGETPIVKSVKLNKAEVLNNTNDINDNIIPYLMDMDYRVVCLQLEGGVENVSMTRLFGGTYEMLQRDILSNRYSKEEYKYRLDAYLSANKITEEEHNKLGDMLNE